MFSHIITQKRSLRYFLSLLPFIVSVKLTGTTKYVCSYIFIYVGDERTPEPLPGFAGIP